MNVSRNGYYTSEYIDHRRHGTPITPRSPETQQTPIREASQNQKTLRFDLPSLNTSELGSLADPDDLPEDITPAQLTYLHKGQTAYQERPRTSVSYDNYYRSNRRQESVEYDIGLFTDQASSTKTEEILFHEKPKVKLETLEYKGYYIDQKKRYDNAEFVKPRIYTHKTFKDVFKADEVDDRYNPIDFVFEDPQEVREMEQKKKFSRVVRNVQIKMGKDTYESYDYHVQQKLDEEKRLSEQANEQKRLEMEKLKKEKKAKKEGKKKRLKLGILPKKPLQQEEKEVFIESHANDSDYEIDGEHPGSKRLRKNIKRKWNLAKKQLEENYFENYAKNLDEKEQAETGKLAVEKAEELETSQDPSSVQKRAVGPKNNFNPVWNYVLSFLVYDLPNNQVQAAEEQLDARTDKIVEIIEPQTQTEKALVLKGKKDEKTKKPSKKGFQSKARLYAPKMKLNLQPYKEVLRNWNQPASAYLAGQRAPTQGVLMPAMRLEQMNEQSEMASEYDSVEYPVEHMVYFDDDEMVEDELVYDPKAGTFVPLSQVQGSNSTMLVQNRSKFSQLHYGTPLTIILNINQLIKSIRIMKIIFAPIDVISEVFPNAQTIVILVELIIFMWMLYELSLLIDAICMAVKAVCAPMIAIGRFMNRIV